MVRTSQVYIAGPILWSVEFLLGLGIIVRQPRSACDTSLQLSGHSCRSTRSARTVLWPESAVGRYEDSRTRGLHSPVKQLLPTPPAPSTTIWYSRLFLDAHQYVCSLRIPRSPLDILAGAQETGGVRRANLCHTHRDMMLADSYN